MAKEPDEENKVHLAFVIDGRQVLLDHHRLTEPLEVADMAEGGTVATGVAGRAPAAG